MKVREAKTKREPEAEDGMRAWAKAEARAKAEIARISAKENKSNTIEAEVRSIERADAAKRKTEETGAQIRAKEEAETYEREREESEERAKAKAKIREKRKGRGRMQRPRKIETRRIP